MPDFLPRRDIDLLGWASRFGEMIGLSPETYGLSATQAAEFAAAQSAFAGAFRIAVEPATRTRGAVSAKDDALVQLKSIARVLARIVRANPNVSDAQRINLGLTPSNGREAVSHATPARAPLITSVSVIGRTVRIRLRDSESAARRGKPPGTIAAAIFTSSAPAAPAAMRDWSPHGHATTTSVPVDFPPTLAPGTRVWITACWLDPRLQSGPMAQPVNAWLQDGVSLNFALERAAA